MWIIRFNIKMFFEVSFNRNRVKIRQHPFNNVFEISLKYIVLDEKSLKRFLKKEKETE